jgi:uncharacterized membrane protein
MVEFSSRILIAAPADRIWSVLADIPDWPRWTPTVRRVEALQAGPTGVGSRFRLHQPKLLPALWTVSSWTPGRGFAWESRALGMTTTAEHILESEEGGARLTLRVVFQGALAPLVALLAGGLTRRYLVLEAQGLKTRAEQGLS